MIVRVAGYVPAIERKIEAGEDEWAHGVWTLTDEHFEAIEGVKRVDTRIYEFTRIKRTPKRGKEMGGRLF